MSMLRTALIGAIAFAPSLALAQLLVAEPPMIEGEVFVEDEVMIAPIMGPVDAEGARIIAMMNGAVTVEEVDVRFWDKNYEVEGTDAAGEDIEITIDANTGAVIEIDD